MPQLPDILCRFLHSQLRPTDPRDPEDDPLDECPLYDGKIHVYNSACSTFFAPSDLSGLYGMRREYIRSCPMWRNEGPRSDCIFVVTDLQAEGMRGLDVARVLCFFFRSTIWAKFILVPLDVGCPSKLPHVQHPRCCHHPHQHYLPCGSSHPHLRHPQHQC